MGMRLNNIINIIIFLCLLASCKHEAQKKNLIKTETDKKEIQIDFFDKKYNSEFFSMLIDESTISEHPIISYLNCQDEGYFTVHFVPKSDSLMQFWKKEFFKNYDFDNFDLKKDNEYIRNKLKDNFKKYNIFSYQIEKEYLDSNNGCTIESIFFKNNSNAKIYFYNDKNKKWEFLKTIKTKILPPYADNDFFIQTFPQFFPKESIQYSDKKLDSINIPKYSTWSLDCKSDNRISLSTNINNVQFNIRDRFSMNAQLKKVDTNKYEFYFTDFPPIIPLPDKMQVWDNMDNEKPVGTIEIISESKMNLTWFGFYYKKTKKYIQTENPFDVKNKIAIVMKCTS